MTRPDRPPRRAAPAPRPYHHGHLRETLLDTAETLLREAGAEALTLRELARAAGVSHAAPYHHFESREALLRALAQRGFDVLSAAMERAARAPDPRSRLVEACDAYVRFARHDPARFRLMFATPATRKAEHPELEASAHRAFAPLLASAMAHDPARGPALALAGWSLAHGLANLEIDGTLQGVPMAMPATELLPRLLAEAVLGPAREGSGQRARDAQPPPRPNRAR